jgi:hypothetical protein
MATYYWGNGGTSTGTWDTSTTTQWYQDVTRLIPAISAPTSTDDVIIDTSSGIGTITCTGAVCNNLTVTASQAIILGATGSTLSIFGNLSFPSGGSFSASTNTLTITMAATTTGKTITSGGKTFRGLKFNGVGGGWTLQDNLFCYVATTDVTTLTNGSLDTNNVTCNFGSFSYSATGTASLTLGTSIITVKSGWGISLIAGLTLSATSSTIILSPTASGIIAFSGATLNYGTVTLAGSVTGIIYNVAFGSVVTLNNTNALAFSLQFSLPGTIGTWAVTGSAGNVVTVGNFSGIGATRTITITNRTTGIDYLDVIDITSNLAPVTFYAGANTILRPNVKGVAATTPTPNQFVYVLTTGTSFTTPANWNNSNNEIHLFGGGGGGGGSRYASPNGVAGAGGGGGGYTKATNVTLSGTITYAIGAAGTAGTSGGGTGGTGGTTTFKSGTYTAAGGVGGASTTTTSTGGNGGVGSTSTGGKGGNGATATVAGSALGAGGGGGAGGPLGTGGAGGNAFGARGGGGGGNGGGTAGSNATSTTNGIGGNNNAGVGGGASATTGFNGGGGGGANGSASSFINGGVGVDIAKAGMGGGGGAGGAGDSYTTTNTNNALFGSGGTGHGVSSGNAVAAGGAGAQGGIVIVYSLNAIINFNFFAFFNGS